MKSNKTLVEVVTVVLAAVALALLLALALREVHNAEADARSSPPAVPDAAGSAP